MIKWKKMAVILLALVMVISAIPWMPVTAQASEQEPILSLSIPDTARVVDYDAGIYAVGTRGGTLYLINDRGNYTSISLGNSSVNDVRVENGYLAVAVGDEVKKIIASKDLTYQVLWTVSRSDIKSVDLSSDGRYVAFLSGNGYEVGVIENGSVIANYSIRDAYTAWSWATWWLDATDDMERIAITAECPPYGGVSSGVQMFSFDGVALTRMWYQPLISHYETTEVRVSEAKDYVAAATSSGTEMNLINMTNGTILWSYNAHAEQFACDGDENLTYVIGGVIGGTQTPPYKYFVLKNFETSYKLIWNGTMANAVDDLDSTPDASRFAFGSDAGNAILLERVNDEVETVFKVEGLSKIDAIEIGSYTLLIGGDKFINLYSSPRLLKQEAISELGEINPTKSAAQEFINGAKRDINMSLEEKLWVDNYHLNSKAMVGALVFDMEKEATLKLEVTERIDPVVEESVECVIDKLTKADEILAIIPIKEAKKKAEEIADPVKKKLVELEIAKAEKELEMAYECLDKDKPAKAIHHFKIAWIHAQKAIKLAKEEIGV